MSFIAAATIAAGAQIAGGLLSSNAANKAGKLQASAANKAANLEREMFEKQIELSKPWRIAGQQALNKLLPLATKYTPFGMNQFEADPGYGFRMSEGMKALERSAAARGGLLSGATLKGVQRFGQDLASQEYMNAFNRYQTERDARLQPLQSLAGVGQTSTEQLGQAGQQMASNVSDVLTSGAAARASGYVGQANALSGALGNIGNVYMQNQILNRLMPQQSTGYTNQSPDVAGRMPFYLK